MAQFFAALGQYPTADHEAREDDGLVKTLPAADLMLPLFTLLCFVFLATTVDSSAYTLG